MKLRRLLPALLALIPAALAAADITLTPPENSRLAGRIHFVREPGGGAGAMKLVDLQFPQKEMRVGPTERAGTGLGLLLGFRLTDEARAAIGKGARVELVVHVRTAAMGGSPSPLKLVLLENGAHDSNESFSWFGAWNNANALKEIGVIDGDPDVGAHKFDVTEALAAGDRGTDFARPMVFFGIYGPANDLIESNRGRHVIFDGSAEAMPRLIITAKR